MADRYSIGAVSRRTGIPVTTLRFYERELPRLFPIRKTAGGHRRYDNRDVSRFATLRALTAEGLPLAEVKRVLRTRGEDEGLAEAIERISERLEAESAPPRISPGGSRRSKRGWPGGTSRPHAEAGSESASRLPKNGVSRSKRGISPLPVRIRSL
jgi:DNA-binding transcriptional MerR regulator